MPKMKTHKGVKRRFRTSASGKVLSRQAGTSHLQTRTSAKRKRQLRGTAVLAEAFAKRYRVLLNGYSS